MPLIKQYDDSDLPEKIKGVSQIERQPIHSCDALGWLAVVAVVLQFYAFV